MVLPALLLVLAQTPPPLPDSTEPLDVEGFSEFVDRHLIAITPGAGGLELRQRARAFRLTDDDFSTAFALVPEAEALAVKAKDDAVSARTFNVAGNLLTGASGAGAVAMIFLPATALVPALIATGVGLVVALVLLLIALPLAASAQSRFFDAVSTHNHGLLQFRPAQMQTSPPYR